MSASADVHVQPSLGDQLFRASEGRHLAPVLSYRRSPPATPTVLMTKFRPDPPRRRRLPQLRQRVTVRPTENRFLRRALSQPRISDRKIMTALIEYHSFRFPTYVQTRQSADVPLLRLLVKVAGRWHHRVRFWHPAFVLRCPCIVHQRGYRWAFAFRKPTTSGRHVVCRPRRHQERWLERRGFSRHRPPGASDLRRRTAQPSTHWNSSWRWPTPAKRRRTWRS